MHYLAHAHPQKTDLTGQLLPHELQEHLHDTARLAATFAPLETMQVWATLAGLWHDLGKYHPDFQHYIKQATGYSAHLEEPDNVSAKAGKVPHSGAGVYLARESLPEAQFGTLWRLLAYVIAGHHRGLYNWIELSSRLKTHDSTHREYTLYNQLPWNAIPSTIAKPEQQPEKSLPFPKPQAAGPLAPSLWVRMLFSCLIDADRLDTEAFMNPEQAKQRNTYRAVSLAELNQQLDQYLAAKATQASHGNVNTVRQDVLAACREKAELEPGFFELAVPTGGGKTLSGTAFALKHALKYGKRRIIYAIPYTSIIEQTAQVLRDALGDKDGTIVLEHHSNLDPETSQQDTTASHLATENWDAPIIVTTNVQLFESLFAYRTSQARKLHNIANSVLILDEVQQLPWEFKQPIEASLQALVKAFGCTVVFSSATQPPWQLPNHCKPCRIIQDTAALYAQLKRVKLDFPAVNSPRREWDELAAELAQYPQVLCIVNTRAGCRALYQALKTRLPDEESVIHLSALMCGAHRSHVIQTIRERLKNQLATRVVSTQLVEAGVDLDFPVVYRAMAGLDSIAQAAGRCNREGLLPTLGRVVVFNPPENPPTGMLRKAVDTMEELFRLQQVALETDWLDGTMMEAYFRMLANAVNNKDAKGILPLLAFNTNLDFQFETAARRFSLIDEETGYQPVIVRYQAPGQATDCVLDTVLADIERWEGSRERLRRLQRYTVTIPQSQRELLERYKAVEPIPKLPGVLVQNKSSAIYDEKVGLLTDVQSALALNTSELAV